MIVLAQRSAPTAVPYMRTGDHCNGVAAPTWVNLSAAYCKGKEYKNHCYVESLARVFCLRKLNCEQKKQKEDKPDQRLFGVSFNRPAREPNEQQGSDDQCTQEIPNPPGEPDRPEIGLDIATDN